MSCSRTQRSDADEAQTRNWSVSRYALYHKATVPPRSFWREYVDAQTGTSKPLVYLYAKTVVSRFTINMQK